MIPANLPPPVPREGAKPAAAPLTGAEAGGEGSFADVLASLAAAGAVRPSFLGQEPAQGVEIKEPVVQAAEIFNEHGLVGSVVTGPDSSAIPAQLPAGAAAPAAPAAAAAAPILQASAVKAPAIPVASAERLARPVAGSAADMLAAAPGAIDFATGPAAASAQPGAGAVRAVAARMTGNPSLLSAAPARSAGLSIRQAQARAAEPASQRFEPRLRQKLAALLEQHLAGSAHELSVGLLAGQEGLMVSVRAERLNREQKERLRADIAELLSSHGVSASEIRLNGEAGRGGFGQRG